MHSTQRRARSGWAQAGLVTATVLAFLLGFCVLDGGHGTVTAGLSDACPGLGMPTRDEVTVTRLPEGGWLSANPPRSPAGPSVQVPDPPPKSSSFA